MRVLDLKNYNTFRILWQTCADGKELVRKVAGECSNWWHCAQSICSSTKVSSSFVFFQEMLVFETDLTIAFFHAIINACARCEELRCTPTFLETHGQIDRSEWEKVGSDCNDLWHVARRICSSDRVHSSLDRFLKKCSPLCSSTPFLMRVLDVKNYSVPQIFPNTWADW